MLDEKPFGLEPDGVALGLRSVNEDGAGDEHAGDSPTFQVCDVVHTARRAAASIGERFDHCVAVARNLVAQVDRGRLGKGRLHIALDSGPLLAQSLLELIEELCPSRLGDVEQAHGETVETRWARDRFD